MLIKRFLQVALLSTGILFFSGCAQKLELPQQLSVTDNDHNISSTIPGALEQISDTQEGIFLNDEKIYIKTDGRSILSILDDLAFKKRFNYTISTEMPKKRIKLYNLQDKNLTWNMRRGKIFNNFEEFRVSLETWMNTFECQDCGYKIEINNDGIEIFKENIPYKNNYKKVFLFHSTTEEIVSKIDTFYKKDLDTIKYSAVPIKSQNAILIRGNSSMLTQISEIIIALDSNFAQVMIESQVFEYDDSINRKIGTALEWGRITNDYAYGIKTNFGENVSSSLPSIFNTLNSTSQKQSLLFNLAMQDRNVGVKIIAEPRVVMKPGQEGNINLDTSKYIIATGVQTAELKEIKTGVNFKITPTILSEETIQLDISLLQSEFIPTQETNIIQTVNKNEIKTTLIVKDGELISIGGIYLSKDQKYHSGIPYLKDIPIAGHLFGSTNDENSRVMIEFMIKPTIKKLQSSISQRVKNSVDIQMKDQNAAQKNNTPIKENEL